MHKEERKTALIIVLIFALVLVCLQSMRTRRPIPDYSVSFLSETESLSSASDTRKDTAKNPNVSDKESSGETDFCTTTEHTTSDTTAEESEDVLSSVEQEDVHARQEETHPPDASSKPFVPLSPAPSAEEQKPSVPPVKVTAEANRQIAQIEEAYGVTVEIPSEKENDSPLLCLEAAELEQALWQLDRVSAQLGRNFFTAMKDRRDITVTLIYGDLQGKPIFCREKGEELHLTVALVFPNWSDMYAAQWVALLQEWTDQEAAFSSLWQRYQRCNPPDFQYGTPNNQWVASFGENAYFATIQSQRSFPDDLQATYLWGMHLEQWGQSLPSQTPLSEKYRILRQALDLFAQG